jgi:glycosyltransferase involved in cell wall biosynthesis
VKRRLLHIANFVPNGTRSFEHFLLGLAAHVVSAGWEVRHAYCGEPSADFARALAALGVRYHVVPMPFTMASRRELNRQLGGYRPTLTLTNFLSAFTPAVVAMKLLGDTPRLVVRENSSGTARPGGRVRRVLRKLRGRVVGRIIDAQLPVSAFVARRSVNDMGLPAGKVHTVYNGIDLDRFPYRERVPGTTLRVAFAGQLLPEKGVDTLLAALARLQADGVAFEARLAGRGRGEGELKALAVALKLVGIQFVGHTGSIPELFAWAEVVVAPSRWAEAFGLVAAEAMATGAVVVASDAGGLPEVLGAAGRVFPAGDAGALAGVLRELAADPGGRRRLGAAGRNRVEEKFRLADTIAGVYEILDRVSVGHRPGVLLQQGVPSCPIDLTYVASGPAGELVPS